MQIVNLTRDRVGEMQQVFFEALGVSPLDADEDAMWSYLDADRSWLAIDDGGSVAGIANGFGTRLVLPGGAVVDGGGVPGFGVRVDRQGTGIARNLMEHQLADAAARGDAFLALSSSQYPIYGRFGFGPIGHRWSVEIDPRRVRWHDGAPAPGRVTIAHGHDVRDLVIDCYRRSFGSWPGEIDRPEGDPTRRPAPPANGREPRSWALLHDDEGRVVAAARHTVEEHHDDAGMANRMDVGNLFGVDEASRVALWRWLLGRPLVGRVSCSDLDPGSALPDAMVDPRLLVTARWADAMWLRILDVERVLGGRLTLATGSVVMGVNDPLVGAAAGAWRLTGDGERLAVERTDDAPGVTVGVDALASLAFAHGTAHRLAAAGHIDGTPAALDALDRLLAWPRPAWASHLF